MSIFSSEPIRRFAIQVFAFSWIQAGIVAGGFLVLAVSDRIPPIRLTGWAAFDHKVRFIGSRPELLSAKTLLAGPSFAAQNLAGEEIEAMIPAARPVLNVGVGGTDMADTRWFLRAIQEWIHPRVVVVTVSPTSPMFRNPPLRPNSRELGAVLRGRIPLSPLLSPARLRLFVRDTLLGHNAPNAMTSFDRTGTLAFPQGPPLAADWTGVPEVQPDFYSVLRGFASDLEGANVRMVCVEMPLWWANTREQRDLVEEHRLRMADALSGTGARYISEVPALLNGSHFNDWHHLNAEGARVFTRALADELRPDFEALR